MFEHFASSYNISLKAFKCPAGTFFFKMFAPAANPTRVFYKRLQSPKPKC